MTVYGASDPQVIGQPISPFFGAQNGVKYAGPPVIPTPNANGSGPAKSALELAANGSLPVNAVVTSINGVNAGANNLSIGGDPVTVAQLLSNGNGQITARGAAIAPAGALNTQVFVEGIASAAAAQATGPTADNTSSLIEAPVSGATLASNVGLTANNFGG